MKNSGFFKDMVLSFEKAGDNAIAFSLYDGERIANISYKKFLDDILLAAGYFKWNGIKAQNIALASANCYEWMVAFFAIAISGNIAVFMNPALPGDILKDQFERADVSILCCEQEALSEMKLIASKTHCLSYEELLSGEPVSIDEVNAADEEDTIVLLFTSGTTGKSKIVELTSRNLRYCLNLLDGPFSSTGMEKFFLSVPLFHIAGFRCSAGILQRHKTICIGRNLKFMFADMAALNPTVVFWVPAIIESVVKMFRRTTSPEERQRLVGSCLQVICVSGATLNEAISSFLLEMGYEMQMFYGMSESTGIGTWAILDKEHPGTIGQICDHIQCRFDDGEIVLKGPYIAKGYYKDPESTEQVFDQGWLHTGDLGYCDKDGYFYLTGRKKNVIILSNGENVSPEEIEAKFAECEAIKECMVYSDGKGICADIYTDNQQCAAAFIRAYNGDVPMYRQVYKVNYSDNPLEKTGSGKIKRKENV